MSKRALHFGNNKRFNLYIGGIGGTINTASLLAAKFLNYPSGTAFSSSNIKNFEVVGSDVKCLIDADYQIKDSAFHDNLVITYYKDYERCKSVGIDAFFIYTSVMPSLTYIEMTECLIAKTRSFANQYTGRPLSKIILPKLTTINGTYTFWKGTNVRVLYIPLVTTLGDTVGNDNLFSEIGNNKIIYTHPSLATCNAGAPDGDLAYAITQGATVRYVTNFTSPNAVTIGNVYASVIQLIDNGSTNAIDYFENVKVNGVSYPNVNVNGYITGLTPNTSYTIEAVSVDIFYNKSTSNTVTQTTSATYVIPTANLISYYKMEGNVLDSVGSNNGTATAITYENGLVGQRAIFNGSTSNILISNNDNLKFTNGTSDLPFSLHATVYFTASGSVFLIGKSNGTNRNWEILYESSVLILRLSSNGNSANRIEKYMSFTPTLNTKYFIYATYDGSETVGGMRLFINEIESTTSRAIGTTYLGLANNTDNVIIGKFPTITSYTLNGKIDEVSIWNTVLTAGQISEINTKLNTGQSLI